MKSARRKNGVRRRLRATGAVVEKLTWAERLDVLDALCQVLDGVYAHLPLKRSLYGFDVIRGLEHIRQEVPTMTDLEFHREVTTLINRMRDAHTQYQGPWTGADPVATLPFLVESFGPASSPTYVVSKVDAKSIPDATFAPGVTIDYWNGIPFDRAVELHAEVETGGRPDSRRARALESLTFRSLEYGPPPNEDFVQIGYRGPDDVPREIRLHWEGLDPKRAPEAAARVVARLHRGINHASEAIRRAKKFRFNHALWAKEHAPLRGAKRRDPFADFLSSRTVETRQGSMGYLRIWSFDVDDDQAFIEAVVRHLRELPDRGLIVDLRANPGGFIWAAERLLQLFTPQTIVPTRFAFRATKSTAAMSRAPFNRDDFAPWMSSLASAEQTGEPYSSHLPITPVETCNDVGQKYGGPIVVVVDANTYSSGDLFTAGIVDNRIGPVVCIGEATGAGGANVWESDDLRAALEAADAPMPGLPKGVRFTIAVRRAVRAGDAEGVLIEDAGITGQTYEMTRDDLFAANRDLIEHCAALLATNSLTRLNVTQRKKALTVETAGLDQLDVYVNGHPGGVPIKVKNDAKVSIPIPTEADEIEVVGFSEGTVRQRRKIAVDR